MIAAYIKRCAGCELCVSICPTEDIELLKKRISKYPQHPIPLRNILIQSTRKRIEIVKLR
jgi:ferredoxin